MCSHFLPLHTYNRVELPKTLWRCGTCGRQARLPVDCCSRPNFASSRRPGLVHNGVRRLGALGAGVLTGLRLRLRRWRRPAAGIPLEELTGYVVEEVGNASRQPEKQCEPAELSMAAESNREAR